MSGDLTSWSATLLAEAIREKRVSSVEVVVAHIERIELANPRLNAVVQLAAARALEEAHRADRGVAQGELRGPLHGVPFTAKDVFETAGVVSSAGMPERKNFVAERDATVVARLRAAGGILLGKTNTPQGGSGIETDNPIYGRTNNPYDLARSAGGSSGGEAAIIAAGGSPAGVGSDSGGSVRLPAHFCGIAGLRPTYGRVPSTGHFPPVGGLADPRTQVGPMARSVADLGLLLRIISGSDGWDASVVPVPLGPLGGVSLKGLRIAYFADDDVMSPTEKTALTVEAAAKALADAGVEVEPARPAGWAEAVEISVGYWESHRGEMTTAEFYRLLEKWDAFRTEMLRFMLRHDAILSATCAFPAPLHDAMPDWRDGKSLSYLLPQSLAGCPAATVRCGWSPLGLPIGVQVSAAPWREDIALALAAHLEQAFGGWSPPLLDPSAESAASHKH